jgi:predicted nuclease of predicted toxin-antitoxin system
MKLLLDENISDRIIPKILDLYSGSEHVKTLGLVNTDDGVIWEYAKINDFVIVSKDADFHQRSLLYGHPLNSFICESATVLPKRLFKY